MGIPKLFISYSWSSPEHEQFVINLATELRESGVDVILDKWDLKEGQDAIKFMEMMVNDPDVNKVAIISDEKYAKKADGRDGGVGTETQIISKEVYENQDQNKFVAIVVQKDDAGRPCLPTYYKSRIYIDLSEIDTYSENFEQLLRWIFDKPLHVKPELGKRPLFLKEENSISLGTSTIFRRSLNALRNGKSYASGALDEYLDTFAKNLERFRIEKYEGEPDDVIVQNIEEFLPYRQELIQIIDAIGRYATTEEIIEKIHGFFENLLKYLYKSPNAELQDNKISDNFKFIIHELFLYVIAILIKHERFSQTNDLLEKKYYLPGFGIISNYSAIRRHMPTLEHRNKRLSLRRLSLRADMLKKRCTDNEIKFDNLMQVDFILFLRSEFESLEKYDRWWPETLLYACNYYQTFEIFTRSISQSYFDKIKCLLKIDSKNDLEKLMNLYKLRQRELPRWGFESFEISELIGYDKLGTIN